VSAVKKQKSVKQKKEVKKQIGAGRPQIEIDMDQLGSLCRLDPSAKDCADFFKCSVDTIEKIVKRKTGLKFADFKDQHLVYTRYQLIRSAVRKAETDTKMHIFALQNMCKWSRNTKVESDVNQNVTGIIDFTVAKEELEKRIEELKKKK
jgi:hypothetical protein